MEASVVRWKEVSRLSQRFFPMAHTGYQKSARPHPALVSVRFSLLFQQDSQAFGAFLLLLRWAASLPCPSVVLWSGPTSISSRFWLFSSSDLPCFLSLSFKRLFAWNASCHPHLQISVLSPDPSLNATTSQKSSLSFQTKSRDLVPCSKIPVDLGTLLFSCKYLSIYLNKGLVAIFPARM